jgi:hypothetical protein
MKRHRFFFDRNRRGNNMALITCLNCGNNVSIHAASCPDCGSVLRAQSYLAWPSFHIATGAFAIAVAAPFLSSTGAAWLKVLSMVLLALVTICMAWIIPAVVEGKRRQQRSSKSSKSQEYVPTRN